MSFAPLRLRRTQASVLHTDHVTHGGAHKIQCLWAGGDAELPRTWRVLSFPFLILGPLLSFTGSVSLQTRDKTVFWPWRQEHFAKAAAAWCGEVIPPCATEQICLWAGLNQGHPRPWQQLDWCSGFGAEAQEPSWSSASLQCTYCGQLCPRVTWHCTRFNN